MKFTVALLQILAEGHDQERNLEKGIEHCRKAKELGADLALFPEEWNIGYQMCPIDDKGRSLWSASAIDHDSPFILSFAAAARSLQMNIAVTYLESYAPRPRNTVSIIDAAGNTVLNYSKVFICDFGKDELENECPNYDEIGRDYNCTPGSTFDVCPVNGAEGSVNIGAMICADREFPEAATQLMLNGAELIVVPNACDWNELRDSLLRARALDNFVGVAMANYPAPQCNGNSCAYSCVGWANGSEQDILIVRADEEEGIFLATFDMDAIREFKYQEQWRVDYRRQWYGRQ
jgi:N-carbamoylputrescine amidase